MRALVTGAAGYIGSVVAQQILDAGHEVVALDNLSQGHRAALPRTCRRWSVSSGWATGATTLGRDEATRCWKWSRRRAGLRENR